MANQDLFKQAIAEAKSVREAAISNAKDVLEESLTPHLKDMLAAKLQEMEEEEMDETYHEDEMDEEVEEEGYKKDKDMDEAKHDDDMEEAKDHDEMEEGEEVEEAKDHEDMDEAEDHDKVDEAEDDSDDAEDDSEESDDEAEEGSEEDVEDDVEVKDMEVEDLKALIRDIISQEMGHEGEEDLPVDDMEDTDGVEDMVGMDDEEIDLDELLSELDALISETEEDVNEEDHDEVDEEKHDRKHEGKKEEKMEEELNEALKTIETLKSDLNETNLLNSKLLYVNKVFKAHNLSEEKKVNIITAFDKAETVKEVKLVYETVSNSINSKQSSKQSIKEHKSFASKATGNTTKGEIISEVSDSVKRMQKLAGII